MLEIRYEPGEETAVLTVDRPSPSWDKLLRAIRERSEFLSQRGPLVVSLPWWEFLACREAIGFYARQEGWKLTVDDPTREKLRVARERQTSYEQARGAEPLTGDEVLKQLNASGFTRSLTSQQLRNVRRIGGMGAAAAFSVPGSGKTTEALAYFALHGGFSNHLLVISPRNAFATWEEQLHECFNAPPDEFVRLEGGADAIGSILQDEQPSLCLMSYRQMVTPAVRDLISEYLAHHSTVVFLDESHRMKKGAAGEIGRAILSISYLPKAKLILSGTPVPNAIEDLVPQFDFLFPEVRAIGSEVSSQLQPIYTRTTKDELGLEPPQTKVIPMPLPPAQRRLYDALRSDEARRLLRLKAKEKMLLRSAGRSAMRLLQATSNPALLTKVSGIPPDLLSDAIEEQGASKIEYVCRRSRELASRGEKSVIWSAFVENVEVVSGRLADIGADFVHGGVSTGDETDEDTREAKIKAFHDDPNKMVLVANPAACAEGISLHKVCHTALFLDRTYNAAHYLQAKDRIHRLGLNPGVVTRIEIVIAPNTIDDLVDRSLKVKVDRLARVLNDPGLRQEEVAGDPDDLEDLNFTLEDMREYFKHLGTG